MSISKKRHKKIIEARKYVNVKVLFKDGAPKFSELTEYKTKKIINAYNNLIALAGGKHYLERDFIPLRKTKRLQKYNREIGVPAYAAGVMIGGGAKVNKDVVISKKLHLVYKRGIYGREGAPLDARTEKTLIKSIKKYKEKINSAEYTMLATNGNYIGYKNKKGHDPLDLLTEKALYLFNKYEPMFKAGALRDNGRKAAKMTDWGLQLLWEAEL